MIDIDNEALQRFAAVLQQQQREGLLRHTPDYPADGVDRHTRVRVRERKKYITVDVGSPGKFMVDRQTGEIFGIKGYGQVHRGHQYGTLGTIDRWDWSGYTPRPRSER